MFFHIVFKEFGFVQCQVHFASEGFQFVSKNCFQRLENRSEIGSKSVSKTSLFRSRFPNRFLKASGSLSGPILGPKMAASNCPDAAWERSRAQTGCQRPSGSHLVPLWKHFKSNFCKNWTKIRSNIRFQMALLIDMPTRNQT